MQKKFLVIFITLTLVSNTFHATAMESGEALDWDASSRNLARPLTSDSSQTERAEPPENDHDYQPQRSAGPRPGECQLWPPTKSCIQTTARTLRDLCSLAAVTCAGIGVGRFPFVGSEPLNDWLDESAGCTTYAEWSPSYHINFQCGFKCKSPDNSDKNYQCAVPFSGDPTGMMLPTLVLSSCSLGFTLIDRLMTRIIRTTETDAVL